MILSFCQEGCPLHSPKPSVSLVCQKADGGHCAIGSHRHKLFPRSACLLCANARYTPTASAYAIAPKPLSCIGSPLSANPAVIASCPDAFAGLSHKIGENGQCAKLPRSEIVPESVKSVPTSLSVTCPSTTALKTWLPPLAELLRANGLHT